LPDFTHELVHDGVDIGLDEGELRLVFSVDLPLQEGQSGLQILEGRSPVRLEKKQS
jgi:hypothetical protein